MKRPLLADISQWGRCHVPIGSRQGVLDGNGRQLHEEVSRSGDQRSKSQPEAVKDHPLRALNTQRPTRITLRREQCGEPISPCRASSRADRWRAQPGSTQSGREAGSGRPSGKGRPGSPENGGQAPNRSTAACHIRREPTRQGGLQCGGRPHYTGPGAAAGQTPQCGEGTSPAARPNIRAKTWARHQHRPAGLRSSKSSPARMESNRSSSTPRQGWSGSQQSKTDDTAVIAAIDAVG